MYDIQPLEENWKKYQSKKRKPWYLFILVFILFAFILIYLILNTKNEIRIFDKIYKTIDKLSQPNIVEHDNKTINTILVNGSLDTLELFDNTVVLEQDSKVSSMDLLVDIPILDVNDNSKTENIETAKNKKVYIDIYETASVIAYQDVEKRFKQTGDIDDALFLARSYYKKGNFEKSEYWAFEVNKLDSSIEDGFFIFVKSKFKLGKTNEAISILNTYLKLNVSEAARILLEQLKHNKL